MAVLTKTLSWFDTRDCMDGKTGKTGFRMLQLSFLLYFQLSLHPLSSLAFSFFGLSLIVPPPFLAFIFGLINNIHSKNINLEMPIFV